MLLSFKNMAHLKMCVKILCDDSSFSHEGQNPKSQNVMAGTFPI